MSEIYFVERNGKRYAYKSTSRYDPEKKYPVTVNEYIGRVDETTGNIIPKKERSRTSDFNPENMRILRFGGSYALLKMAEKMGLREDLNKSFGPDGDRLLALTIAQILSGGPLSSSEDTIEGCMIRELMGLEDFSFPKISEFRKMIGGAVYGVEKLFKNRVPRSRDLLSYNITSVFKHEAQKGWDRDRSNEETKQADVGLVTDRNGIPAMFGLYPGPISDVMTLEDLAEHAIAYGAGSCILVMDRAMGAASDLDRMLGKGTAFIMPGKRGTKCVKKLMSDMIKAKDRPDLRAVHDDMIYSMIETSVALVPKDSEVELTDDDCKYTRKFDLVTPEDRRFGSVPDGKRMRTFIFYNREYGDEDNRRLRLALAGIEAKLKEMDPYTAVKKQGKVAGQYSKYIECSIKDGKLVIKRKRNAVSFTMNRSGISVMFTNGIDSWESMMSCYDCRAQVEQAFGILKNELDGDKWKTFDPSSVRGRSLIKFVSLVLWCGFATALRSYEKRIPVTSALQSLDNIMAAGNGNEWRLTEVAKKNKDLLKFLGLQEPQNRYYLKEHNVIR